MSLARFVFERRVAAEWVTGSKHLHLFFGNEASDADSICRREDFKIRAETDALLRQAGVNPDWLVYRDEFELPDTPPATGISLNLLDHNRMSAVVTRGLEWPSFNVSAVWDHHPDQGLYKSASQRHIEFDETSATGLGSCCTIVAECMQKSAPELLDWTAGAPDAATPIPNSSAALALLGVILLDTAGLSESAGKATPRDIAAVNALADRVGFEGGGRGAQARALFEDLSSRKFGQELWASLSLGAAIGADYKQSVITALAQVQSSSAAAGASSPCLRVGFASVLAPIDVVLRGCVGPDEPAASSAAGAPASATPDVVASELAGVCRERGVDALLVLGFTLDGADPPTPVRELLLFCPEHAQAHAPARADRVSATAAALKAPIPSRLGPEPLRTPDSNPFELRCQAGVVGVDADGCAVEKDGTTVRWAQGRTTASRKQIRPAVEAGLREALTLPGSIKARL